MNLALVQLRSVPSATPRYSAASLGLSHGDAALLFEGEDVDCTVILQEIAFIARSQSYLACNRMITNAIDGDSGVELFTLRHCLKVNYLMCNALVVVSYCVHCS